MQKKWKVALLVWKSKSYWLSLSFGSIAQTILKVVCSVREVQWAQFLPEEVLFTLLKFTLSSRVVLFTIDFQEWVCQVLGVLFGYNVRSILEKAISENNCMFSSRLIVVFFFFLFYGRIPHSIVLPLSHLLFSFCFSLHQIEGKILNVKLQNGAWETTYTSRHDIRVT